MNCPICKKRLEPSDPEVPFCSERCRVLDLGNWADGSYRLAVPLPDAEESAPETQPGPASESSGK